MIAPLPFPTEHLLLKLLCNNDKNSAGEGTRTPKPRGARS